jgi:hypothetical protein
LRTPSPSPASRHQGLSQSSYIEQYRIMYNKSYANGYSGGTNSKMSQGVDALLPDLTPTASEDGVSALVIG